MKLLIILLAVWLSIASAAEPQRNLGITPASGEKRVALVIGNSAYKDAPLKNPVNDARDMAETLRRLGFDVIEKTNVGQKDINRAIAQFGEKLRADTVALFFYAGHGMQVKGKNYIIPIDAHITSEVTVRAEAVDVDTVMDQLTISPMNIVILDACRNNPFERKFRSTGGGLAQMDAPKGSLIAYATAPGKTAADGESRNGLYTQELLKHIQTPGLPVEAVFKRVRNGVMAASGESQTPWEASSLTGEFFFRPVAGATSGTAQQVAAPVDLTTIEVSFWDSIKNSIDAEDYQAYLDKYPSGQFVALAERRVKKKPAKLDEPVNAIAPPKEGDFWRYRGSNHNGADAPTYRVTRISGGKIELRYTTNINEQMILTLNSDWNPISQLGQEGASNISFVPFAPQYQFPLVAGKKWRAHYKGECGALCSYESDYESEVRGWERITVPAGTFDVLRIDSKETFRHLFGAISIGTGSVWLAPEVKNPVKFDYTYSGKRIKDYELEAYQVAD